MGEAKIRRRAHADVLARGAACIYCGEPADTIEHMPPVIAFRRKQRPKGLEFPACDPCNRGTRLSDQIAALMARTFPDAVHEEDQRELASLLRAVSNNAPVVLQEMQVGRGGQKIARRANPGMPPDTFVLRADGPLLTKHMLVFAAKFGFAVHFQLFGEPVPSQGAVMPMWFSNLQAMRGELPTELIQAMPPPLTLTQGMKEVSEQFRYTSSVIEDRHSFVFATFRESFAVAAITALDRDEYLSSCKSADRWPLVMPGEFNASSSGAGPA